MHYKQIRAESYIFEIIATTENENDSLAFYIFAVACDKLSEVAIK